MTARGETQAVHRKTLHLPRPAEGFHLAGRTERKAGRRSQTGLCLAKTGSGLAARRENGALSGPKAGAAELAGRSIGNETPRPDGKGWTLIMSDRVSGKVLTLALRVLPAMASGSMPGRKSRTGR